MDKFEKRRGKVTRENLEEARLLRALWEQTYDNRKLVGLHSQGAFGAEYDIGNQAAVGFFLLGKTALSKKAAMGFAKGLGCSIADFSPRLAAEIDGLSKAAGAARTDPAWPFPLVSYDKVMALPKEQRIKLETAILLDAAHLGLDVRH